jgi:hypothetical protein
MSISGDASSPIVDVVAEQLLKRHYYHQISTESDSIVDILRYYALQTLIIAYRRQIENDTDQAA